jgi:hypothetical protein
MERTDPSSFLTLFNKLNILQKYDIPQNYTQSSLAFVRT